MKTSMSANVYLMCVDMALDCDLRESAKSIADTLQKYINETGLEPDWNQYKRATAYYWQEDQ